MFLICYIISPKHVWRVMGIYGWKLLTVSHHLAMFGGHWSSPSEDIKFLIYIRPLKTVMEGSSNSMSENSSWYITTLPSLVAIGIATVDTFYFVKWWKKTWLKSHVIIERSADYNWGPSANHHPAKFGVLRHCSSGDIILFCHVI